MTAYTTLACAVFFLGGMKMVKVNGEDAAADGKMLLDYLEEAGYAPARIAVERNGEIVPRAAYESVQLAAGDVVEIVSFVGGG